MSTQHEALPQLSGCAISNIKALAADAENAAITARCNTDLLLSAYLDLQNENVRQHALIVQMAEALEVCKDTFQRVQEKTGVSTSAEILAEQTIAAAKDYLK